MATILEALQNARVNLVQNAWHELGLMIGSAQLDNVIVLLEKGYSTDDDVEELIGSHESVHDVPQNDATKIEAHTLSTDNQLEEFTKAAMQGFCANSSPDIARWTDEQIARWSLKTAVSTLDALKEHKQTQDAIKSTETE